MPLVTAQARGHDNGDIVTEFVDSVGTTATTWTYPTVQNRIRVKNEGNTNITVSVNGTTHVIQRGETWSADVDFTSVTINSASKTQQIGVSTTIVGGAVDALTASAFKKLNDSLTSKTEGTVNLQQYESFKVAVADGYDYMPAVIKACEDVVSKFGQGSVVLPPILFDIYTGYTLPDGVGLIGIGTYQSGFNAKSDVCSIGLNNYSSLINLKILNTFSTTRGQADINTGVAIYGTRNHVERVWIDGAKSAGMLLDNASENFISKCIVENTFADGYHVTNKSKNNTFDNCIAKETGDDSYAVVSYQRQGECCREIRFTNCYSYHSKSRGFAVVGGKDIRVHLGTVESPRNAGVYVAMESSYETFDVDNVELLDISVWSANTYGYLTVYAGIHISSSSSAYPVKNILCRNIKLYNSRWRGISIGGTGSTEALVHNVTLENVEVIGNTLESGFTFSNTKNLTVRNLKIKDVATAGVFDGMNNSGNIIFDGVTVENANITQTASTYGIAMRGNADYIKLDNLTVIDTNSRLNRSLSINDACTKLDLGKYTYIGGNKGESIPNMLGFVPVKVGQIYTRNGVSYVATGTTSIGDWKVASAISGNTASRPTNPFAVGTQYYDTTLGKQVNLKTVGTQEVETLSVTAVATAAGNITVTLNSVGVTVAVLAGDTATTVATKIRSTQHLNWLTGGSGTSVTFTSVTAGAKATPTFADTGTTGVTASISVTTVGTNNVWVDATGTTV